MINLGYPINWTSPLNRGLQAWWLRLPHTATSKRWLDLRGKYHGAATVTSVLGPLGRPGAFAPLLNHDGSGTGNVLAAGAATTLLSGKTIVTIAGWFYHRSGGASGGGRIQTTDGEANIIYSNFGGGITWDKGGTAVNLGVPTNSQWYHFACVLDGTNMIGYIDGASVASTGLGAAIGACTDLYFYNRSGGDRAWDGMLDDMRIYDRALSAEQVKALYRATRTYYNFELNRIEDDPIADVLAAAAGARPRLIDGRLVNHSLLLRGLAA